MALRRTQPYIYPSKGQSQEQQERDKFECYNWARQQTGFDPTAPSYASTPPPPPKAKAPQQGGLVQGGARGAALGAVGGAIAGNAGKGAAIGGATGAMVGGMRRADQGRSEKQQQRDVAPQGGAPSHKGGAIMSGPNGPALRGAAIPCNRGEPAERGPPGVYQNTEEL